MKIGINTLHVHFYNFRMNSFYMVLTVENNGFGEQNQMNEISQQNVEVQNNLNIISDVPVIEEEVVIATPTTSTAKETIEEPTKTNIKCEVQHNSDKDNNDSDIIEIKTQVPDLIVISDDEDNEEDVMKALYGESELENSVGDTLSNQVLLANIR